MFGDDSEEFMKEWEATKRRCEVSLTNLLIRRAQEQITAVDVAIVRASEDVARYCSTQTQIEEVSNAILAVKQKVTKQETSFRNERLNKDRERGGKRGGEGAGSSSSSKKAGNDRTPRQTAGGKNKSNWTRSSKDGPNKDSKGKKWLGKQVQKAGKKADPSIEKFIEDFRKMMARK